MQEVELVSVNEVANDFDVNPNTVYRWLEKGWIPNRYVARRYYIDKDKYEEFVVKATSTFSGVIPKSEWPKAVYEMEHVSQ